MRTTVTLDADAEALLHHRMAERGISFKQALNDAVRAGLGTAPRRERYRTETANMGEPTINLDHALRVAGELEDEEIIRKMRAGK
jgi:hypothetical protein